MGRPEVFIFAAAVFTAITALPITDISHKMTQTLVSTTPDVHTKLDFEATKDVRSSSSSSPSPLQSDMSSEIRRIFMSRSAQSDMVREQLENQILQQIMSLNLSKYELDKVLADVLNRTTGGQMGADSELPFDGPGMPVTDTPTPTPAYGADAIIGQHLGSTASTMAAISALTKAIIQTTASSLIDTTTPETVNNTTIDDVKAETAKNTTDDDVKDTQSSRDRHSHDISVAHVAHNPNHHNNNNHNSNDDRNHNNHNNNDNRQATTHRPALVLYMRFDLNRYRNFLKNKIFRQIVKKQISYNDMHRVLANVLDFPDTGSSSSNNNNNNNDDDIPSPTTDSPPHTIAAAGKSINGDQNSVRRIVMGQQQQQPQLLRSVSHQDDADDKDDGDDDHVAAANARPAPGSLTPTADQLKFMASIAKLNNRQLRQLLSEFAIMQHAQRSPSTPATATQHIAQGAICCNFG